MTITIKGRDGKELSLNDGLATNTTMPIESLARVSYHRATRRVALVTTDGREIPVGCSARAVKAIRVMIKTHVIPETNAVLILATSAENWRLRLPAGAYSLDDHPVTEWVVGDVDVPRTGKRLEQGYACVATADSNTVLDFGPMQVLNKEGRPVSPPRRMTFREWCLRAGAFFEMRFK